MATKGEDGFLKIRKESTGRPCLGDEKLVPVNLSVTVADKEWLDSFGNKSAKARAVFKQAREK
jgi:hypothetical protein